MKIQTKYINTKKKKKPRVGFASVNHLDNFMMGQKQHLPIFIKTVPPWQI